jgi:hypothetical protein
MNLPARRDIRFARASFSLAPTARDSSRVAAPNSGGGEGRIRTSVGIRRQIYSLLPLATWVPLLKSPIEPLPGARRAVGQSPPLASGDRAKVITPRPVLVQCCEAPDVRDLSNIARPVPNLSRLMRMSCASLERFDQAASTGGADGQTRTGDLLITNQLLYQLSYIGNPCQIVRR